MKKADIIEISIDTPAIGEVFMEASFSNKDADDFILKIPRRRFVHTDYTLLDISHVIKYDIKKFKKLNECSDENHQIFIDTLCVYGIKIIGNYIRVQYWFNQNGDKESHRMCAGCLTYTRRSEGMKDTEIVFPECYSSDVCVYW